MKVTFESDIPSVPRNVVERLDDLNFAVVQVLANRGQIRIVDTEASP